MQKLDRLRVVDNLLVYDRSNLLRQLPPFNEEPDLATRQHTLLRIGELTVLLSEVREHLNNLLALETTSQLPATDPDYQGEQFCTRVQQALTQGLLPSLTLSPALQAYIQQLPHVQQAISARERNEGQPLVNPDDLHGEYHAQSEEEWLHQHDLTSQAALARCEAAVHALCVTFPQDMQQVQTLIRTRGNADQLLALLD